LAAALVLVLVGLTSLGATAWGVWRLGLPGRALGAAAAQMLECVGLTLLFVTANVGLGFAAVLAARALTGWYVSFYLLDDALLVLGSALQAVTFARWRAGAGRR
jgi:hypothetical protein